MIDMGTHTSDIEVRPQRDGIRVIESDDNVQVSCPLVDVILPTGSITGVNKCPCPTLTCLYQGMTLDH